MDLEIHAFAATLNRCFRDARWDVVSYYAENAWHASKRTGTGWPDVEPRVRAAWEAGVSARTPKGHRVLEIERSSV
jgi:hypothetical protein